MEKRCFILLGHFRRQWWDPSLEGHSVKEVTFSCSVISLGPVPAFEEGQDQRRTREGKKKKRKKKHITTVMPKEKLSCTFVESMCWSRADVTNYVLYLEDSRGSWEVPLMTVDLPYPSHQNDNLGVFRARESN